MTDTDDQIAYHRGHRVLPDGFELCHMRKTMTLAAIGDQFGVSRQAVYKAIDAWKRKQTQSEAS